MTRVNEDILQELGWGKIGNKYYHESGIFIYVNKIPESLRELVNIMTGNAFRKGQKHCIDNETI